VLTLLHMDHVTRQFINLTKKLRKELRVALSDLKGALHKQTEAIREANQRRDNEQCPSPEIIAAVNLPERIGVHQNAKDTRDERNYKRATFFVTSLTFGAVIVYAVLVFWQYQEMIQNTIAAKIAAIAARDASRTAAAQLELAERPWVDAAIMLNGPLTWNVNGANLPVKVILNNTGHSPALSTDVSPTPLIGAIARANAYSERDRLCQDAMQVAVKNPGFGNALFPNVPPFVQPITIGLGKFTDHSALKDFPESKFPPDVALGVSIIFCIAYRPSFDNTAAYYTAYITELHKTSGSPMFKIGESLKQSQLALYFDPVSAIKVGEIRGKH
jgi:hypothetical protein